MCRYRSLISGFLHIGFTAVPTAVLGEITVQLLVVSKFFDQNYLS